MEPLTKRRCMHNMACIWYLGRLGFPAAPIPWGLAAGKGYRGLRKAGIGSQSRNAIKSPSAYRKIRLAEGFFIYALFFIEWFIFDIKSKMFRAKNF